MPCVRADLNPDAFDDRSLAARSGFPVADLAESR
jgi:hypothetical protein